MQLLVQIVSKAQKCLATISVWLGPMIWSKSKLCPLVILLQQVFEVHGHLLYQDHNELCMTMCTATSYTCRSSIWWWKGRGASAINVPFSP